MTEAQIRSTSAAWKDGARVRLHGGPVTIIRLSGEAAREAEAGWRFVDRLLFGAAVRLGGQRFFHPAVAGAAVEPEGEFVGDRRGIIERRDSGFAARVTFGRSDGARAPVDHLVSSYLEAERACVGELLDLGPVNV